MSKLREAAQIVHESDCATNNGPALPLGECDCLAGTLMVLTEAIHKLNALRAALDEEPPAFVATEEDLGTLNWSIRTLEWSHREQHGDPCDLDNECEGIRVTNRLRALRDRMAGRTVAHVCGLQGFGAEGDVCQACAGRGEG